MQPGVVAGSSKGRGDLEQSSPRSFTVKKMTITTGKCAAAAEGRPRVLSHENLQRLEEESRRTGASQAWFDVWNHSTTYTETAADSESAASSRAPNLISDRV